MLCVVHRRGNPLDQFMRDIVDHGGVHDGVRNKLLQVLVLHGRLINEAVIIIAGKRFARLTTEKCTRTVNKKKQ